MFRFHEDFGDLKKNTIRDDIESPTKRPRKIVSPVAGPRSPAKNLLITHKKRARVKSPKKNPYAKYLVEG